MCAGGVELYDTVIRRPNLAKDLLHDLYAFGKFQLVTMARLLGKGVFNNTTCQQVWTDQSVNYSYKKNECQENILQMLEARNLSGVVARNLSGL